MSLFAIGLSGLNAGQVALQTTGNNIVNVNTPGHNREITRFAENGVANGVQITSVDRQFNQFVADQYNQSKSITSGLSSYMSQINQLDALLSDLDSGLPVMMQSFFSSVQDLSGNASDSAARQGMIGSADNMTAQFRAMDNYLSEMQERVNGEVNDQVSQINNISSNIANLNKEISLVKAKTGQVPNALLNQRDQLVSDLSERINIRVSTQDNGIYNIAIGSGISLVAGSNSFKLEAVTSAEDPTRQTIAYRDGGNNLISIPEKGVSGGSLGGVLSFRTEALDTAQNRLGQMAVAIGTAFNETNQAGLDLEGNPGEEMFSVSDPRSYSNERNASTAYLEGVFSNGAQVGLADFDVRFDSATGYIVTNRITGAEEATFSATDTTLDFGGMTFNVNGTPADGDRFLVRPFYNAAGNFDNKLTDGSKIAAALPDGDTGSGDNRNALAMYDLQFERLVGGTSTFNQGYASMINDIGNRSQIVKVNLSAQESLTQQLRGVQQSESGVNLDEEAANLLRFQQYYQASARIIETASTVMDTILGIKN